MKPSRIIIATAIIMMLSSMLSGCSTEQSSDIKKSVSSDLINIAQQAKKEVTMKLESERDGDTVTVKIVLDNPESKPIISVQSWLSYNPKDLSGNRIEVKNSPFNLMAPYDNTFDENLGLVMIGRSVNTPITTKNIVVAEVVFNVLSDANTFVDIYDYRNDLTGHSSVNMMVNDTPFNILIKPNSPALVVNSKR